jgi:hypothetical protein
MDGINSGGFFTPSDASYGALCRPFNGQFRQLGIDVAWSTDTT